jgi:RNA polymerase sigma-70 factor (ECF subfamily)
MTSRRPTQERSPDPAVVSDPDDFTAWVRPHWAAMRRVAERLAGRADRDDVLQEALAAAWRHRDRFDPARGTAQAWLVTITVNAGRKSYRRKRPVPCVDVTASTPADPDLDLRAAINQLPDRQRLAVELFYFAGLPISDVATAMKCAEGTVKSTLSAARDRLRTELGKDEG